MVLINLKKKNISQKNRDAYTQCQIDSESKKLEWQTIIEGIS